jgi:hypothetical protein
MLALVSVHPKPMVVGGRVFGEDGWKPALLQMAFIIIEDAYDTLFPVDTRFFQW